MNSDSFILVPDPNDTQRAWLKRNRDVYGAAHVKGFAADGKTGNMRVELKCAIGIWQWFISPDGELVDSYLVPRLFEPASSVHRPRNATDN